jgi:hypothetical protein
MRISNMQKLVLCSCMLVAGACSAAEIHQIDGAASNFCLPEVNKVADVPWAPADKLGTPTAFAFAGCGTMSGLDAGKCDTPKWLLGGVVEAKSAFHSQKWRDLDTKSMLKQIALSPGADIKSFENGSIVVVHNEKLWHRDWYVWGKARRLLSRDVPHMDDDDVLLTTCHNQGGVVQCDRWLLANDYALHYTFESDKFIPQNLRGRDADVIAAIDHWRCMGIR